MDSRQCVELIYSDGSSTAKFEAELDDPEPDRMKAVAVDLDQRFT